MFASIGSPCGEPEGQSSDPRCRHRPDPSRQPGPGLLPTQDRRGQDQEGSHPGVEAQHHRRRVAPAPNRPTTPPGPRHRMVPLAIHSSRETRVSISRQPPGQRQAHAPTPRPERRCRPWIVDRFGVWPHRRISPRGETLITQERPSGRTRGPHLAHPEPTSWQRGADAECGEGPINLICAAPPPAQPGGG